jgi:glycine oxidase
MKTVDYIIVGQGLAGTLLAHDLIAQNQSLLIIDKPLIGAASRVAAGIINPVGMKRCIPSYNADQFLDVAFSCYRRLQKTLNHNFFKPTPILRLFANQDVSHQWQIKFSNTDMQRFINQLVAPNTISYLHNHYGSATIEPAARLEISTFLEISRSYFEKKQTLFEEQFDFKQLKIKPLSYKGFQAKKIIFCEGYRLKDNPFFSELPLTPTKGEVMTIKVPQLESTSKIISKGVYILPLGNHHFIVGSTYHHTDLSDTVTVEGLAFLNQKVKEMLKLDFEVVSAVAGVRPTVKDRKSLIGLHPKHNSIGVFNGFGTRGALQGPLLSQRFSTFLTQAPKNTQSVDCQRLASFLKPNSV